MAPVAVIGGGVVGVAVTHALAVRGAAVVLLEAEPDLALGASGTSSGILHTGFDSSPGALETALILRSATLREELQPADARRCGALLRPLDASQSKGVARLADNARRNGVEVRVRDDGALEVPGEAITDPVAYTLALATAARAAGAEVRTGARVTGIRRQPGGLELELADGDELRCRLAVNCAGLHADDVARLAGDDSFEIYPRKGEFLVFDPPGGRALERILLPVPTERTKGVLVFPTLDGRLAAGPTAHDQEDKDDWSVRPEARDEILGPARRMLAALERAEPIASYAGLRPAGRGVNYVIGPSPVCAELINVAAIRSTGLSASLGIGEHVAGLVGEQGVELGAPRPPAALPAAPAAGPPWWRRTARHRGIAA